VGLCTVYLDTHWVSDVLGGWIAGVLVLIALPWVMPYSERLASAALRLGKRIVGRGDSPADAPAIEAVPPAAGHDQVPVTRPLTRT
jgi:hypothetical protein